MKEGLENLYPEKGENHGRFPSFLREAVSFVRDKKPLTEEHDDVERAEATRPVLSTASEEIDEEGMQVD